MEKDQRGSSDDTSLPRIEVNEKDFGKGRKTVSTRYVGGKLDGKIKRNEEYRDGKLNEVEEYFYDADGNEICRMNIDNRQIPPRHLSVWYRSSDGSLSHAITYEEGMPDVGDLTMPSSPPSLPLKSKGYLPQNVRISTALSEDGNDIVITLKNVSDSSIEVHDEVFLSPNFGPGWFFEKRGMSTGFLYTRKREKSTWEEDTPKDNNGFMHCRFSRTEILHVVTLAPNESLTCTTSLKDIFTGNGGQNNDYLHSFFSKVPDKAEFRISVSFNELFPQSSEMFCTMSFAQDIPLGEFRKFKTKHPNFFRKRK